MSDRGANHVWNAEQALERAPFLSSHSVVLTSKASLDALVYFPLTISIGFARC
jgi:hypothetical protein